MPKTALDPPKIPVDTASTPTPIKPPINPAKTDAEGFLSYPRNQLTTTIHKGVEPIKRAIVPELM